MRRVGRRTVGLLLLLLLLRWVLRLRRHWVSRLLLLLLLVARLLRGLLLRWRRIVLVVEQRECRLLLCLLLVVHHRRIVVTGLIGPTLLLLLLSLRVEGHAARSIDRCKARSTLRRMDRRCLLLLLHGDHSRGILLLLLHLLPHAAARGSAPDGHRPSSCSRASQRHRARSRNLLDGFGRRGSGCSCRLC